jgi:hypothetical protein
MEIRRAPLWGSIILSVFVLVLSSATPLARIPNEHCHCHDKKKTSQSAPCPFAELRTLGSLLSFEPVLSIENPALHKTEPASFVLIQQAKKKASLFRQNARDPPVHTVPTI